MTNSALCTERNPFKGITAIEQRPERGACEYAFRAVARVSATCPKIVALPAALPGSVAKGHQYRGPGDARRLSQHGGGMAHAGHRNRETERSSGRRRGH